MSFSILPQYNNPPRGFYLEDGTPHPDTMSAHNNKLNAKERRYEQCFITQKTSPALLSEFSMLLKQVIAKTAFVDPEAGHQNEALNIIFDAFDNIKMNAKPGYESEFKAFYSEPENAIIFSVADVEIERIQIINQFGAEDIILNGTLANQWGFLSACEDVELEGMDALVKTLCPCHQGEDALKAQRGEPENSQSEYVSGHAVGDAVPETAKIPVNIIEYPDKQNICPEKAVLFLARLHGIDCKFSFDNLNDRSSPILAQIDLSYPIIASTTAHNDNHFIQFTNGKTEQEHVDFLERLDKQSPYLVRNGTNNGSGHYAVYFYKNNNWHVYDYLYQNAINAEIPLTQCDNSNNRFLTQQGKHYLVKPSAPWGNNDGQVSTFVGKVSKEVTQELAQYINIYRGADANTFRQPFEKDDHYRTRVNNRNEALAQTLWFDNYSQRQQDNM